METLCLCTGNTLNQRDADHQTGIEVQRVKRRRVWNHLTPLLSPLSLLSPSSLFCLSSPRSVFLGPTARPAPSCCYLHNCLSPPPAMGKVAFSQRYRGNADWWSRWLSGCTTSTPPPHTHTPFYTDMTIFGQNKLHWPGGIVSSYEIMEDMEHHSSSSRRRRRRHFRFPLFERRWGRMTKRNFTAVAA